MTSRMRLWTRTGLLRALLLCSWVGASACKTEPVPQVTTVAAFSSRFGQGHRDFSRAILADADLSDTNMPRVIFQNAQLNRAVFTRDLLKDADFSGASAEQVQFTLTNLTGANFSYASLQKANFAQAVLRSTNFAHADMRGAQLLDCEGVGADLRGADLTDAMLDKQLGSCLRGMIYDDTTKLPAGFDPAAVGMTKTAAP